MYGGSGQHDQGYSVQQTSGGGYIVAGPTGAYGAGAILDDVWLIRTDGSGDTLWTSAFGGIYDDVGNSVQETSDGGYIMAGYTISYGAGSQDVWLIRTEPEAAAEEGGGARAPRPRLQVYPNPFRQQCSLAHPGGQNSLRIFELTGRLIQATAARAFGEEWSPGTYVLKHPAYEPTRVIKIR
jgi:hypothetical protein